MVHQEKPQQMLRLFCCTIPFGTDSHFAQALVFVSRGLVAKNAPQEHFLDAPTDGAPKNALHESVGRFFIALFQEGTIWCTIGDTRTGRRHASAVRNATVRRSLARGRVPDGAPRKAATDVAAFLLHHSLRDGLALRASARVRLAGTGR